jgi:Domain of unknown function (DUF4224)
MGLFLTEDELQDLTGYKTASKQVTWLKNHGYYVETNVRGIPKVTNAQIEDMRRTFMKTNNIIEFKQLKDSRSNSEPDFNCLRTKIKKRSING